MATPEGGGGPKAPRKRTDHARFKRDAKIAAMAGAGIATPAISRALDVTPQAVGAALRTLPDKPELLKIFQDARDQIGIESIEVARLAVATMKKGLTGYKVSAGLDKETGIPRLIKIDCPPDKAATVLRELRPGLGMGDGGGADTKKPGAAGVNLNLEVNNPEVAAAIVRALREGSDQRRREIEVQGERTG